MRHGSVLQKNITEQVMKVSGANPRIPQRIIAYIKLCGGKCTLSNQQSAIALRVSPSAGPLGGNSEEIITNREFAIRHNSFAILGDFR